jgi:hypothetical protein
VIIHLRSAVKQTLQQRQEEADPLHRWAQTQGRKCTNVRDVHIRDYDDIKFFVTNSVFSGPLPNDPWISFGANCYPNSITMSCVIMGGLNHPDCPTNSPKGSLSHPFVQSAEHALLRGFPFPECSRNRSLSLQLQSGRHPLQFLFRILGLARARL